MAQLIASKPILQSLWALKCVRLEKALDRLGIHINPDPTWTVSFHPCLFCLWGSEKNKKNKRKVSIPYDPMCTQSNNGWLMRAIQCEAHVEDTTLVPPANNNVCCCWLSRNSLRETRTDKRVYVRVRKPDKAEVGQDLLFSLYYTHKGTEFTIMKSNSSSCC